MRALRVKISCEGTETMDRSFWKQYPQASSNLDPEFNFFSTSIVVGFMVESNSLTFRNSEAQVGLHTLFFLKLYKSSQFS